MLVKDLVNNAIYRGTNQKMQTVLLGRTAIVQAINFALNDIYTYEWKEWTFMYNKTVIDLSDKEKYPEEYKTIKIDLDMPIKKVFKMRLLKDWNIDIHQPHTPPYPWPEWKISCIEPTIWVEDLMPDELYFKPWTKEIYIPNNKNEGYILHWISFFNPVDWEDEIPLPEHFMWALYNLVLCYLYPINWQYGVDKESNNYNIAQTQLVNLAKTDAYQMNHIIWNIH